ncbi:insulin-like growth factor-binding protein complex acid labile subunit [Bacillus rossius redtenbacheri]|uniref:insulin-like growth factor-binding protein complex acid labile subunit n=1 Tax=Bacillus rossius redtenbacheri TaxID=93214 RepID=UPI002FDD0045
MLAVLVVQGVLMLAAFCEGHCPASCRCSDYVHKTFCRGSCDGSLPPDISPQTVDLSAIGYNLTVLRRRDLQGWPGLTDLTLDDNHVFEVEPNTFHDLAGLVTLSLQDNLFERLDRDLLAGCPRLEALHLGQSSALRFPADGSFLNSASLRSLFLENCRKLSTRRDFNSSAVVRVLDMRHFAGLKNLKELSVRNSGIDILEVTVPIESCSLVSFDLRNNFLETIPSGFFMPFLALEVLYLGNNKLEILSVGVFTPLKILKRLFLGSNSLQQLSEGLFEGLTRLELLDLSENNLVRLDAGLFRGLGSLRALLLADNALTSLDGALLVPLKNLESLDLTHNPMETAQASWFSALESLDEVRLTTPCDCALRRLWEDMVTARVRVVASCGAIGELTNDSFSGLSCTSAMTAGALGSSPAVWISVVTSLTLLLAVTGVIAAVVACHRNRRALAVDHGSYHGVSTGDTLVLPSKPCSTRPPSRPPNLQPDED